MIVMLISLHKFLINNIQYFSIEIFFSFVRVFFLSFQERTLERNLVLLLRCIKWYQSLFLCQEELSYPSTTLYTQFLPLPSINSIKSKKQKKTRAILTTTACGFCRHHFFCLLVDLIYHHNQKKPAIKTRPISPPSTMVTGKCTKQPHQPPVNPRNLIANTTTNPPTIIGPFFPTYSHCHPSAGSLETETNLFHNFDSTFRSIHNEFSQTTTFITLTTITSSRSTYLSPIF